MDYSLENARNGKNISKMPLWPSLRTLTLKSKFIPQFEFLEHLEDIYGKCLALQQLLEIQTLIKFHSLMPEASNFQLSSFQHVFSLSGILKVAAHNFMENNIKFRK